ncbi:MAG: methyl-accepting chemotaxis protein, partial [Clostridiales bacterium]|nr:methyl-accepting chemotaxis protein [Clostridiales bacterium]
KEVMTAGILTSPASGKQVIADYYPIYDEDGTKLGMVGGGILADKLMDQLKNLKMEGLENSKYLLLDLKKNCYIFHTDAELIGTPIENKNYLEIKNQIEADPSIDTATYEYKDLETNKKTIAVYKNIADKQWAFVIIDTEEEVYASVRSLSHSLLIICIIVLLTVVLLVWITVHLISKDLVSVAYITKEIGTLDLSNAKKLNSYGKRKDEIGEIANATITLSKAVTDAVCVLKEKEAVLLKTSEDLLDTTQKASDSVTQVDFAIQDIAQGATNQAQETERATSDIMEIGNEITDTAAHTNAIHENAMAMIERSNYAMLSLEKLNEINKEAVASINIIAEQTNTTNQSAQKIKEATSLITSISEETNLLSLNASIEAARAGEQGRGFAVVAAQIQKLAEQSNNSATQIDQIINSLITDSMKAVDTMGQVNEIMTEQSEYVIKTKTTFEDVKTKIDELLAGVDEINTMMNQMDESREKIVDVVQGLSAIAQENAASAEETSASTTLVNEMTAKISESARQLQDLANEISNEVSVFTI